MAGAFERWKSLGVGLRLSLVAGFAMILVFTVVALWWLASEEYNVLFADLEPRDAASIVSALEEMKVDYRLADGGSQIQVPESLVYKIRLKLMGSDMPMVGGAGFEIFNDSDFGMTEFSQRINYQRALEGELTRTVVSLKEVKYARVHLVIPERGLFKQDDNPSSASVTLFLKAGYQPMPKQVLGVQRLVAAAVPGLSAGQVTVTDQNGLTLSPQLPTEEGVAAVSERLRQKQAVEAYLIDKAGKVLERHFGVHEALVSIDVELDFSQVKRTLENVLPLDNQNESGVVRRRETRLGSGAMASKEQRDITTEVEYRLGREIEQIVETPGKIIRLSVGVMVPSDTSADRSESILELVKMAVGYDEARGDAIAIHAMNIAAGAERLNFPGLPKKETEAREPLSSEDEPTVHQKKGSAEAMMNALLQQLKKLLDIPVEKLALLFSTLIAVLVILAFIVRSVLIHRSGKGYEPTRLSEVDRQRLLEDIHRWLDHADTAKESETA